MKGLKWLFGFALVAAASATANAGTIDVLWYGEGAGYNAAVTGLAATASTYDPASDGSNTWNLTFWNAGDPTPNFANYDVLVIGTTEGGFGMGFDKTRLLAAEAAIQAARGTRTFLTGQDADWHYQFGPGAVDNGPRGFLINAVNWAGSGSGLGIVSMPDGHSGDPSQWWFDSNSFLKTELTGFVDYAQENSVIVVNAGFPVNEGLTSAGLSNWGTSSHLRFIKPVTGYLSINDGGSDRAYAVTIVSAAEAGGPTTPVAPLPSSAALGIVGLGVTFMLRRRNTLTSA